MRNASQCQNMLITLSQPYAEKVGDSLERLWSMLHVLSWTDMTLEAYVAWFSGG